MAMNESRFIVLIPWVHWINMTSIYGIYGKMPTVDGSQTTHGAMNQEWKSWNFMGNIMGTCWFFRVYILTMVNNG